MPTFTENLGNILIFAPLLFGSPCAFVLSMMWAYARNPEESRQTGMWTLIVYGVILVLVVAGLIIRGIPS